MFVLQVKYREEGLRSLSHSLYSQLPQTSQTRLARSLSELHSPVRTYLLHLPLIQDQSNSSAASPGSR